MGAGQSHHVGGYGDDAARGHQAAHRRFVAEWVRYDHDEGLLFTDAPVLITDSAGSYRGGGFQYYVRDRRFRLMGGASVVQDP